MYVYTIQAMPGCKAKFEGDTSIKYRVRRTDTHAPATHKSRTEVIRTGLDYEEATALVKKFNDKERESRAIKKENDSHLTSNA